MPKSKDVLNRQGRPIAKVFVPTPGEVKELSERKQAQQLSEKFDEISDKVDELEQKLDQYKLSWDKREEYLDNRVNVINKNMYHNQRVMQDYITAHKGNFITRLFRKLGGR